MSKQSVHVMESECNGECLCSSLNEDDGLELCFNTCYGLRRSYSSERGHWGHMGEIESSSGGECSCDMLRAVI